MPFTPHRDNQLEFLSMMESNTLKCGQSGEREGSHRCNAGSRERVVRWVAIDVMMAVEREW